MMTWFSKVKTKNNEKAQKEVDEEGKPINKVNLKKQKVKNDYEFGHLGKNDGADVSDVDCNYEFQDAANIYNDDDDRAAEEQSLKNSIQSSEEESDHWDEDG